MSMSQVRTRKRPAPGSAPVDTAPSTNYNTTSVTQNNGVSSMATNQYLQWPSQTQNTYPDPSNSYGSSPYNEMSRSHGLPMTPLDQLATRSLSQQLVPRDDYNGSNNGTWPVLADGAGQPTNGALLNQDDDLDRKADIAKRETQAKRKQIPPFVQKLSSFLDEDRNTDLIRWSDKGDSFIVVDEDEFARTLIPELFKHKNYASFVRQLNMYGFHKKVGLSDNSMRASERKDKSPSEYYHPYFRRGRSNLLWLVQKPKNPQGKSSGKGVTRSKQDDANMEEDGDEPYDVDSPAPASRGQDGNAAQRSGQQPLLLGNANSGNPGRGVTPSQDELAAIHQELAEVRKNQKVISEVLQQMARENERRAQAYQTLHDRHENSINAMLTFLATVYNRSLSEGQGVQNFGNVLAGAFPQDAQQQGSVVDMGDYNEQNANQTQPLFRRQPLLLKAPPPGTKSAVITPNAQPTPYLSPNDAQQTPFLQQSAPDGHSPHIQELFSPAASNRSSQSPKLRASNNGAAFEQQQPEADIMSLINTHNAQNTFPAGTRMDFPEALSHLQTAEGKTPLTPNQRNNVLQLMAGSSAESGNNNALTSPDPPHLPETNQFDMTREQLAFLGNAIKDQEQKVGNLTQSLAPLSRSGSIPGMDGEGHYNGSDPLLDIDSIFNSGDYFNDEGTGELDFTNGEIPDFDFGTAAPGDADGGLANLEGYDGTADERSERGSGVETLGSSEVASPAVTVEDVPEEEQQEDYGRGKRRRKN